MKKWMSILLFAAVCAVLVACSADGKKYSPEEVVQNVLNEQPTKKSYYGESTQVAYENGELLEEMTMKEWRTDDGKVRLEVADKNAGTEAISVFDGKKLTMYDKATNSAFTVEEEELGELTQRTAAEQALLMFELIKDSHDVKIEGEEKILGRNTYHIVATPKNNSSIFGEQQAWIDKETWMALRMESIVGDLKSEAEYTKLSFDEKMTDDLFVIELPDDVNIEEFDGDEIEGEQLSTVDEAKQAVTKPFVVLPETDDLKLASIEKNVVNVGEERAEITFDYERNDELFLSITVFESDEGGGEAFQNDKEVTVRGNQGLYFEMGDFRNVSWHENGVSYFVELHDLELTLEEVLELLETME